MQILIDTHTLVWWMVDGSRLSRRASETLSDLSNRILISAVVAWELAIKVNVGKIHPPTLISLLEGALAQQVFAELPISLEHAVRAGLLPLHHRDPFDRLLVAQAQAMGAPILSADRALDAYDVRRIW
jgi:PIN domain nuclease of toxin-antitoxin system